MEDKDFLGYFNNFGDKNIEVLKNSANNIVNTLLALDSNFVRKLSRDSTEDALIKQKAENSLKQKYDKGDLGENMTADLNYTLKRLVRGLYSENHKVKQGFFLGSVLVLSRFKDKVDFEKYMNFIKEETKINGTMRNSELHSMILGRMMCISAIVESGWIQIFPNQSSQTFIQSIIDELKVIYDLQDLLRESIHVILLKLLNMKEIKNIKMFEQILDKFFIRQRQDDVKELIVSSSSDFSIFLFLKNYYQINFQGKSKKWNQLMHLDLFQDQNFLNKIGQLVKTQIYSYPRLHSSIQMLLQNLFFDLSSVKNQKIFLQNLQSIASVILEKVVFNEDVLVCMRSIARYKLMHIGFKIVSTVLQKLAELKGDQYVDLKIKSVNILLIQSQNFKQSFVRNVQLPKNQMHEISKQLKNEFIQILSQIKMDSQDDEQLKEQCKSTFQNLIDQLFGPCSLTHFSQKKNQDLMLQLSQVLDEKQITEYLEILLTQYEKPDLKKYFPEDQLKIQGEGEILQMSQQQKEIQVKLFCISQAGSLLNIFKDNKNLTSNHVMIALNLIIRSALTRQNNKSKHDEILLNSQFKLFSLITNLQKHQFDSQSIKRGYFNDSELWIMKINKLIRKIVMTQIDQNADDQLNDQEVEIDLKSLCKIHKGNLKFVQQEISDFRIKLKDQLLSQNFDKQLEFKLKEQEKKLCTFEQLFLSISPLILLPQVVSDQKEVVELLEDLEELKECYKNLGLNKQVSNKKAKTQADEKDLQEAHTVLMDFLTSLLTKPQSFLRDVANYCFKQFCTESLDDETLNRLLKIVGTKNQEAGEFMEVDEQNPEIKDEVDEEVVSEQEESSDLNDI